MANPRPADWFDGSLGATGASYSSLYVPTQELAPPTVTKLALVAVPPTLYTLEDAQSENIRIPPSRKESAVRLNHYRKI
jgi:hypothetical protein